MDSIAIARQLASVHTRAKLPCPVCAASLKAENMDSHLAKVHAGVTSYAETAWKGKGMLGIAPVSLALEDNAVALRHWLLLARRIVRLPCRIEIGGTVTHQPNVIMEHEPATEVRTGRYLRLVGDGGAITIGCKQQTQFASHWARSGYTVGKKRGRADIRLPVEAMVAIEYALATRGMIVPA